MDKNFEASKLWKNILSKKSDLFSEHNIDSFRTIDNINSRLASWDPKESSTRYYKTLLLNFAMSLDKTAGRIGTNLDDLLSEISNQNLGSPVTINFNGLDVSLDYLLCVEEYLFINSKINNVTSVLEIGAGFGRTCHFILSVCSKIKNYTICDLPETLNLSKYYLKKVLDEQTYKKIQFLKNSDIGNCTKADLSININSFQEMESSVIINYLEHIAKISQLFFTKNPTGKYTPESIDRPPTNKDEYNYAMSLGLCTELIDLFNPASLENAAINYNKLYKPKNFKLLKDEPSQLWRHYHSALYEKIS